MLSPGNSICTYITVHYTRLHTYIHVTLYHYIITFKIDKQQPPTQMVVSLLAGIYPVPTDTATCLTDPKTTCLTCVHTVLATMAAKATVAPPNKSMLFAFLHEQALAVPVEVVDGKNSILHANHVQKLRQAAPPPVPTVSS